MGGFFKSFFAALFALVVFTVLIVLIFAALVAGLTSSKKPSLGTKGVLVIDLSETFREQAQENPLSGLTSDDQYEVPGLYDLVRLVRHAAEDSTIRGIYLKCNDNANGFASSEEIRNA